MLDFILFLSVFNFIMMVLLLIKQYQDFRLFNNRYDNLWDSIHERASNRSLELTDLELKRMVRNCRFNFDLINQFVALLGYEYKSETKEAGWVKKKKATK